MFTDCNAGPREVESVARNVTTVQMQQSQMELMANHEARATVAPMGPHILAATSEGRLPHPGTTAIYEVDYLPYTDLRRRSAHRR